MFLQIFCLLPPRVRKFISMEHRSFVCFRPAFASSSVWSIALAVATTEVLEELDAVFFFFLGGGGGGRGVGGGGGGGG